MSGLKLDVGVSIVSNDNVLNTFKIVGAVSENVSLFLLLCTVFCCEYWPRAFVTLFSVLSHTGGTVIWGVAVVRVIRSVEKAAVRTRVDSCAATSCPVFVRFAMGEKTRVAPKDSVAAGTRVQVSVVASRTVSTSAKITCG